MWDWIVNFLYTVLAGLQSFSGDWGMAVILLTIIIRIILVPMTNKQTASIGSYERCSAKAQRNPGALC